jgi:hypothetical protein
MHWLKKYWQAMIKAASTSPISQTNSRLRVDVAACRITAPPIKQKQRAFYISRKGAEKNSAGNKRGTMSYEVKQAGKNTPCYVTQSQDFTFDERFVAPVVLADDVLFIPISSATGAAGMAVAMGDEFQPVPHFVGAHFAS